MHKVCVWGASDTGYQIVEVFEVDDFLAALGKALYEWNGVFYNGHVSITSPNGRIIVDFWAK